MSEIKHTPGSWKVVDREVLEDGSVYPTHIVSGPQDHQVCMLEASVVAEIAVKEPGRGWGIRSADARLIAAAPELLAALQGMLEVYGVREQHLTGGGTTNAAEVELCERARAAIAKAIGAS